MVCEKRSLRLDRAWRSEQLLRRWWNELVAYRVAAKWVPLVRVDDFEGAVVLRRGVVTGGPVHDGLADLVEVAVGVRFFIPGGGVRFFVKDGVLMSINCRIDSYREPLAKGVLTVTH